MTDVISWEVLQKQIRRYMYMSTDNKDIDIMIYGEDTEVIPSER